MRHAKKKGQHHKWLFDVHGRQLGGDQPSADSSVGQRKVPDAVTLGSNRQDVLTAHEVLTRDVKVTAQDVIRAVDKRLNELTHGRVNLSRLSSELRILPTTPAWAAVEVAMKRLDSNRTVVQSYPEVDQDVAVVAEYSAMLARNGETIALALLIGKLVGRLSLNIAPDDQLFKGLTILSSVLSLSRSSEERTSSQLKSLIRAFKSVYKDEIDASTMDLQLHDVDQWSTSLRTWLDKIDSKVTMDIGELRNKLYEMWLDRFTKLFREGEIAFVATVEDLLGAATGEILLPKLDTNEMTLADWTGILFASTSVPRVSTTLTRISSINVGAGNALPSWFAIPALAQLGFTKVAEKFAADRSRWGDSLSENAVVMIQNWFVYTSSVRRRQGAIVLVRASQDTRGSFAYDWETFKWKPSSRFAALWWHTSGWLDLHLALTEICIQPSGQPNLGTRVDLGKLMGIDVVLLEVSPEDSEMSSLLASSSPALNDLPGLDSEALRTIYLLPRIPQGIDNSMQQYICPVPQNLVDAMNRLAQILESSPRVPPPPKK